MMTDRAAGVGVSSRGIRFPLLGVPVLVRWSHFLLDVVLLWPLVLLVVEAPDAIVSVAPMFFMIPASVLVHEVGHAAAAAFFGGNPRIELVFFGGLTYPALPDDTGPGRRAIVSLAGPLAGIAAGAAVWAVTGSGFDGLDLDAAADLFVWAAAVWGGLNLVPLPGLDGGHVLDSSAELLAGSSGLRVAAVVKGVTAAGVLVAVWQWAGLFGVLWIVIILGRTGVDEIRRGWEAPRIERLREAIDLRRRGRFEEAVVEARAVRDRATDRGLKEVARQVMVAAAAAGGDWETVIHDADGSSGSEGPALARALIAVGRASEAEAVARGIEGPGARLLLAEALVHQNLAHLVETGDSEADLGLAVHATRMEAEGRPEAARALASEIATRHDVSAGAAALARLQLGEPVDADRLPPEWRRAVGLERAGRARDTATLHRLLDEGVDVRLAGLVLERLQLAGRDEAAVVVGRAVLEQATGDDIQRMAHLLARSLARTGRGADAADVLGRSFPDGAPESVLADPDLRTVLPADDGTGVPGSGSG